MREDTPSRHGLGDVITRIQLPELILHIDRLIVSSEKKCIRDPLLSLGLDVGRFGNDKRRSEPMVGGFNEKLCDRSLTDGRLLKILKMCHYHLHKTSILEDSSTNKSSENQENQLCTGTRLPQISLRQTTLRPTVLLDRVIDKHNMVQGIVIPTMVANERSSYRSSDRGTQSSGTKENANAKQFPHFNYEHAEGMKTRPNLPVQPGFIRMLTEPEMSFDGNQSTHINNELNTPNALLSLYGGSLSPPLINKDKQTRPRKRRIVCKFCRRPPGDHHKWCIYYNFSKEETPLNLARSNTEDDIDLSNNVKHKIPVLERSKTELDDVVIRPDVPDYASLHRDVYAQALSDSRARLVKRRTHDFAKQLTKPFVFSYFHKMDGCKCCGNKINGMKHIFGEEHTNFTKYYKLSVTAKK